MQLPLNESKILNENSHQITIRDAIAAQKEGMEQKEEVGDSSSIEDEKVVSNNNARML